MSKAARTIAGAPARARVSAVIEAAKVMAMLLPILPIPRPVSPTVHAKLTVAPGYSPAMDRMVTSTGRMRKAPRPQTPQMTWTEQLLCAQAARSAVAQIKTCSSSALRGSADEPPF
jgi:hypothetical protein